MDPAPHTKVSTLQTLQTMARETTQIDNLMGGIKSDAPSQGDGTLSERLEAFWITQNVNRFTAKPRLAAPA